LMCDGGGGEADVLAPEGVVAPSGCSCRACSTRHGNAEGSMPSSSVIKQGMAVNAIDLRAGEAIACSASPAV
jgi:hypothetical protein